ncbi:MAG: hypothetical protein NTW21_29030 [Verrucomicrobia bacterium]|nr:hypothetical protein [Verrucomicrobiota bacterium]
MKSPILCLLLCGSVLAVESYPDGRPACKVRLDAKDQGIVLRYGDGPDKCDYLGARDVWVYENQGKYYMHYDGAGHKGWLACLAESPDLVHWTKKGPVLDKGEAGKGDSATASYGTTYFDGKEWHMFYVGCPNCTQPPDCVPAGPYLTMKAKGASATGPWTKQYDVVPIALKPGSYYAETASPGFVVRHGGEYLQFVSVAAGGKRSIGIARATNLDGSWKMDPEPMVPLAEQLENTSMYYEPTNQTWFLFTNHVGINYPGGPEFTDAIWVYWTKDLNRWDATNKALVLDRENCKWSDPIIGLPSVLPVGHKLAVFYDGSELKGDTCHMRRCIGLAWLELPLNPPLPKNENSRK